MENKVVTKPKVKFSVALQSDAMQKLINNTLRDEKRANRFIASISSAVANNSALQECDSNSIISGALVGEALELSPSPVLGQYYLIPFKNNKEETVKAQFVIGANGYKQLAMRSGQYADIDFIEVREGEYLGRDENTGKQKFKFISDDEERETRPVIGYYAYFELINGYRKQLYWSKSKMEKHADKYSKAFNLEDYKKLKAGQIPKKDMWKYSSYWYTNFDGMAEKTMYRQLISKYGIMSIEMQEAYTKDMAVIRDDGTLDYVDNPNEDNGEDVNDIENIRETENKAENVKDVEFEDFNKEEQKAEVQTLKLEDF